MITTLLLFVVGSMVGIIGALLGIGGGVLMVPYLVLVMDVPIHQAVAVSLVSILATSSQVASYGIRQGLTNIRLAYLLNLSTLTGAILSSSLAARVPAAILETLFAFLLFAVALLMLRRPRLKNMGMEESETGYWGGEYVDPVSGDRVRYRPKKILPAFFTVFFSGALSGMVGTSGGIFNVPIMNILCRVPLRAAAETSSLMVGITAVGGAIVYYLNGFVEPLLVAPIVAGVLGGSALGNRLAARVTSVWLVRIFVILLVLTALKMLLWR